MKTEVFENDYFTVLDTSKSHVPVNDGTVFGQNYVIVQKGKDDSKTQRVDADFFLKTEQKSPFSNKNCKKGYVWTEPSRDICFR